MSDASSVRDTLAEALLLDLVGPTTPDHRLREEVLTQAPSRWYLTGFLVPTEAEAEQRCDPEQVEDIDAAGERGGVDDAAAPEPAAARTAYLPSSMGLSLLMPSGATNLRVAVRWGDYAREQVPDPERRDVTVVPASA